MMTASLLTLTLAFYVHRTVAHIEASPVTVNDLNRLEDAMADQNIECLIVDLANYEVRADSGTVEWFGKVIRDYASMSKNIVFIKTPLGYWGVYEITQGQFENVMGYNPSYFQGRYHVTRPVENVSRNEANAFISNVCERTGLAFRLPSKDEWISACLAGNDDVPVEKMGECGRVSTNTPRSDELKLSNAWKCYFSFGIMEMWLQGMSPHYAGTQFVGQYRPNAWGLYDMHGNVMEWTTESHVREGHPGTIFGILMGGACTYMPADCTATSVITNGTDTLYSQECCGFRVMLPTQW